MRVAARRRRGASAEVLRSIQDLVQEQGLKAGEQLPPIRELAERLEVKQSVVRDALLQAQTMGWVRILPRAGAFLQAAGAGAPEEALAGALQSALGQEEPNPLHLLDARRLIEIELAGRAAEHRRLEDLLPVRRALEAMLQMPAEAPRVEYVGHDIRFHVEIARLAGNGALFAVQRTLMELLRPHLNEVPRARENRGRTDRSHAAIYAALVAGDADKARTAMREHLSMAYDSLLRDLQEPPRISERRGSPRP
jgi:GntR family transcriptional repressor for pyruvate dehydrogenase complex